MALETSNPLISVTGPVEHYVRIPAYIDASSGTAVGAKSWYLGTCETQPQISLERLKAPVFNDLAGRMSPFQFVHGGYQGMIGVTMTRFSHLALAALKTFSYNGNGFETRLSRGSLILANSSIQLIQQYSFYGTANASTNLPPGRAWAACILVKEDMLESGTAVQKPLLVFEAYPLWNGLTRAFTTYSELAADVFAADLIPQ